MRVLVGIERPLGLGDQLQGAGGVGAGSTQDLRFPPGHGQPIEGPVLDEGGFRPQLEKDLVAAGPEPSEDHEEDREDDHHEDDRDRDEDERRAR